MLSPNAKRAIAGQLPLKRDIVNWGGPKILEFLKFISFFIEDGQWKVTVPVVEAARRRALEEDYWDEFVARIDPDGSMPVGRFSKRLYSFARIPLSWLKSNPHAVTAEMYEIMQSSARMKWAVAAFKAVETEMGVQIVVRDNDETTDPGLSNVDPKRDSVRTPAVQFEQAKLALITLMNDLVKGLTREEIKKMSAKDRIAAFDRLLNTGLRIMGSGRPSTVIFQQINTKSANRDELEKAMLEYATGQTSTNE